MDSSWSPPISGLRSSAWVTYYYNKQWLVSQVSWGYQHEDTCSCSCVLCTNCRKYCVGCIFRGSGEQLVGASWEGIRKKQANGSRASPSYRRILTQDGEPLASCLYNAAQAVSISNLGKRSSKIMTLNILLLFMKIFSCSIHWLITFIHC